MGTGYTRNDTSNNIADAKIANASDIDGEFDAIQSAFDSTSGHTHDGTSAEGGPVTVVGPAQDLIISGTKVLPKTDSTLELGDETYRFKNLATDSFRVAGGQTVSYFTDWTSFTANFFDETGNVSPTSTTCRWMRIGNVVHAMYSLVVDIDSTGMVPTEKVILELPPVTPAAFNRASMATFLSKVNYGDREGGMIARLDGSGNLIFTIYDSGAAASPGTYTDVLWSMMTDGDTDFIGGSLTYEAA